MKKYLANLFFKDLILAIKNENYNTGCNDGYLKGYDIGYKDEETKGKKSGYLEGFDEGSKGGTYINSNGICMSNGNGNFIHALSKKLIEITIKINSK